MRAAAAFVASQPAILFAYTLWGGYKELAAAWLIALGAALIVPFATARHALALPLPPPRRSRC